MQSKGQIQIVFLLLIVVGLLLFTTLPKLFKESSQNPASYQEPVFEKEATISSPKEESPSTPLPSDTTPPKMSNPQPTGGLPAETRKINLSLETNEKAICRYTTVSGVWYEYMQHTFSDSGGTSHSTQITTLSEGEEYKYYVRCIDEEGNKNMDDFEISFKVKEPEDTTPPERFYLFPTGNLRAGTTQAYLSVSTNEPASCRYSNEQGNSYSSMSGSFSRDEYNKHHTVTVGGLESGKTYSYFVRCQDLAGNKNTGDIMIKFSITP